MNPPFTLWLDDSGLLFDEPELVAPMYRWRLVPVFSQGTVPVHNNPRAAFYEYRGENTALMLVSFEKDAYGNLINPTVFNMAKEVC